MVIICRKHFIYHYVSHVGHLYFYQNKYTTSCHVGFIDGNAVANGAVQRLHVSHRKHACSLTDYFQYCSFEMVLHYCKINHDKRGRIYGNMERDFDTWRHYVDFIFIEFKKL